MTIAAVSGAFAPRLTTIRKIRAAIAARAAARNMRNALNSLSPRSLEDIGLAPGDIEAEVQRARASHFKSMVLGQ